jgi:hypothetical protein
MRSGSTEVPLFEYLQTVVFEVMVVHFSVATKAEGREIVRLA